MSSRQINPTIALRQRFWQKLFIFAVLLACGSMKIFSASLYTGCSSHVNSIVQDKTGYLWLATDNGLYRYDGCNTRTFSRTSHPSLLSDMILSVFEDSNGELWVGTSAGIQKFHRETEEFETPRLSYPGIPDFTYISSITEDSKGNLWFTTSRSGLVSFQGKDRKPTFYLPTNSGICSDKTTTVFEDKYGNIWVGSADNGVTMFNPVNKTMMNFHKDAEESHALSGNIIYSIVQTNDGDLYIASLDGGIDEYNYRTHRITRNKIPAEGKVFDLMYDDASNSIYIGTDGNGLSRYDLSTGKVARIEPDIREFDFRHAKVHDIIKDSRGNIWCAVYQQGALVIPAFNTGVENIGFNPFNPSRNIGNEPVLSLMRDSRGDLWIGTDGDGTYVRDSREGFRHLDKDRGPQIVMCLFEDSRGDVWAGSYLGGLYKYNKSQQRFQPSTAGRPDLQLGTVNVIDEDDDGRLWIGTNGNGIVVFDPEGTYSEHIVYNRQKGETDQIYSNTIHSICFDHGGNVWIGTSDAGISKLDPRTGKFQQFNLTNRQLNNNCVFSIVEDRSGKLWVSTATGLVSISGGKPEILNATHGIPESPVYGLLTDRNGNLWFNTQTGVSCLDSKTRKITTQLTSRRLGCREFKRGAVFGDNEGNLYFGGVGGAVKFNPINLKNTVHLEKISLNELTLFSPGHESVGKTRPLFNSDEIKLSPKENTFTVSFGAFEFLAADDVAYYVMLEGYNDTWQMLPKGVQMATFSELSPGSYTLRIKAVEGVSEVETEMPVIIDAPLYRSSMAMMGYGIFIVLLLGLGFWSYRKSLANRREHQRLVQEERIKEEKLQFFTDISHEVRTPLTLILSPISNLKKSTTDKKTLHTFEMMESNGQRILRMIDQVIDLRKYDSYKMELRLSLTDIRAFLSQISSAFSNILNSKNITFSLNFSEEVPERIWLDSDKIDKVVFNVLANAVRFTSAGGKVGMAVDIDGNNDLRIRISDTGPGIPADMHNQIFERFSQVKSETSNGGTGIGLHLSKKMMESHHGNIFVEESSAQGTTFAIIIPLEEVKYAADRKIEASGESGQSVAAVSLGLERKANEYDITGLSKPHTVLIIDDDTSIISFLKENLSRHFNVITATDGTTGLEAVLRHRPHCVVTDIMLDGEDGLEICRKIRSNSEICDIPVILLTAKASEEHRIEGIRSGADSYIVKPFNMDHLRTQIAMLIQSRRVMKEKFSNSSLINDSLATMKSSDEKLLSKLESVVVEEIANPELSVQFIADRIGMSRSHLHRKLKELTNTNPVAYIKQARMKHALILLNEKGMTVSEVAFATGFNSLSHFSTVFKEFYGVSPTKYVLMNPPVNKSEKN